MIIYIRAHPLSSKKAVIKKQGIYHVYTVSPAHEGKANKDIVRLIAKFFKVNRSSVSIIKGLNSRNKVVKIIDR